MATVYTLLKAKELKDFLFWSLNVWSSLAILLFFLLQSSTFLSADTEKETEIRERQDGIRKEKGDEE